MSKVRIRFSKTGSMKFIGHLDCMRFFQKVMRLSGIDIRYSEGYSPHQIMSFASPLGVGIESDGEYVDIEVNSVLSGDTAVALLNRNMPEGLHILSYRLLPDDAKNAMSVISAAEYLVSPKQKQPLFSQEEIDRIFTDAATFPVVKKTKKSETVLDLKEFVYEFRREEGSFFLRLSAGSGTNIKPELLLPAFFEKAGQTFDPMGWQVRRLDLFAGDPATGFRSLEDFGRELTAET